MPLVDDLQCHPSDEELDRRKLLGLASGGAIAAMLGGAGITTISFLSPNVLFEESSRFKIGRPEDVAIGTLLVLERQKVYVFRTAQGFFAMSAVCTHLGCVTRFEAAAKAIFCPCHGSRFDQDSGRVTGGPAPKPLVRLRLFVEKGQLVVDTKVEVGPEEVLRV